MSLTHCGCFGQYRDFWLFVLFFSSERKGLSLVFFFETKRMASQREPGFFRGRLSSEMSIITRTMRIIVILSILNYRTIRRKSKAVFMTSAGNTDLFKESRWF